MSGGKRDYKKEYREYAGSKEEIHKRVLRNAARRHLMELGLVHKGDRKDVDHRIALSRGGTSVRGNLRVLSRHANRSFRRTASGAIA